MALSAWNRINFSTDSITTQNANSIVMLHARRPSLSLNHATEIAQAEKRSVEEACSFLFQGQSPSEHAVTVAPLRKVQPECIIAHSSPTWKGGGWDEDSSLANSVRTCLRRSSDEGWNQVLISTEALESFGFPSNRHVRLVIAEAHKCLIAHENMHVTFVGKAASSEYHRESLRQKRLLENEDTVKCIGMSKFGAECTSASIVDLHTDAIVNAANNALRGGGGVDEVIHQAAGPELPKACRSIGHCATGHAVVTDGFRLPASYIIHTVGPVWTGGAHDEDGLLASCYMSSLEAAVGIGCRSVAFPAISCGAYGFPNARAVKIAIRSVQLFKKLARSEIKVYFSCFGAWMKELYETELQRIREADENEERR